MAKKLSKEDKLKRVQNLAKMEYTPPANVKTEGTKYDRARAIIGTDKVFDGEKTYEVTNQSGQVLGTVSYDAKEAIEKNKLDSYKPKNDEEKRVIDGLVNATRSKRKENNNPVFERYNIDPNKFEFSDFLKWADEHNYKTKDLNSPDAVNYSPTNYSITPKYEGGFLGIGGKKMTTEQEDKDMEFLRKFAIEKTDNFANKTVDATLYTTKELVKNPVKTGTYLINKASAGATGVLENTIKLVEAAPDWTISKAARMVGADDFANRLEQNVKDIWDRETYAERQSKRADEEINDDKVKFVGNLVENAGALVPAIATEVATAGASPALDIQIASLVGGKTFKALSKVTNTKAGKILSNMTKPSQLVFQSGVFGSSASNAYRETGDVDKAMAYGALTAIAEGFTEQIFGGFAGTDMGSSLIDFPITNNTARKVVNLFTEGAEEIIMSYGDTGIKRITGVDKNAALPTAKEVIESGVSGILLSGLMSAATYPVNKSQTKKIANSLNVITNALNTEISDEKLKFVPLDKNASEKEIIERQGEIEDFAKEYASALSGILTDPKTKTISTTNAGEKLSSLREEVIKTGLESPKESEAYKNAKTLSKKKNVSDYDLGKQYLLNVEQVSQETTEVKTRFAPGGATENIINLEKSMTREGVDEKNIEKIVSDAVTLESSLAKTPTTNMTAEMVERANGTITTQAKNNLAMNGAKNADYWGIYGTNLKILSKNDKMIDEGFIDTYAEAYAEGLKEGNSISYHSLAKNTDNVAKVLKNYMLTGAVPETMRSANIVEKAGENLKGIIQSAVGSLSSAHKIVYGEGTNIARQAEAIKNGDFSSVIREENNNTMPSVDNTIDVGKLIGVMNSTFREGAMADIAEIMSEKTGEVDMGVFAYKLAEYYQKNGNITLFRKYFTDGGIAVTKTLEDMTNKPKTTPVKEKTAPPETSIFDMEDMESETATEDVTKDAEGKVSSEAETSETETEETEKSAKAEKEKAKTESEKDKEIRESVPEKEEEKAKDNSGKALKRLGQKGKAAYRKVLEIEQSMHSEMSEYEVLREFEKSYRAGREGVRNTDGSRLTEQSRKVAEKAGKDDRKNKSTAKANVSKKSEERVWQPKKATEKTVEKESVSETKEPKSEKSSDSRDNIEVQGKGTVKWSSLHPRQQKAIVFMEGFAKAANMKLVFVANSPNFDGAYDISGDTMYLDIYAGVDPTNKLSDIIIPTASHELTHWMHYQAPVLWNKLSSAVFSALEEVDGINRADRINSEIERLKGKGLVHNELVAEDEIVARACEDMLAQSEMGKKVFESLSETEQKTITSKIKDILTNLKNWISDFLSSYKPSNRIEAEKIRQAQDKVNEILKLWNEGIAKSVDVSKAETKAEAFIGNDVYEQYGVKFEGENGMLLSEKDKDSRDEKTFSYDELVAKGDLLGVVIKKDQQIRTTSDGSIDADFVVSEVKKKCESIKTKASTPTYYTNVPDIDRNVEITKNGVIHSFFSSVGSNKKASQRDLINARVSLEIPQILRNSIEVNRSKRGNNLDVPYSHVMMGTVAIEDDSGNLEYYAVRSVIEERANQNPILAEAKILGKLYAVNAKKIGTPNAQVVKNDVALTYDAAYTYNIAQFLNDVKTEFNDTFSEDVYKNMRAQRQNNVFSKNLLFSEKDTASAKKTVKKTVKKTPEQIYRMQNRDIIQFIRDEYDKSEKFMPRIEDVKKSANKLGKGYTGEKNLAYEFGKLYKEVKAAIAYGEKADATEQEIKRKWNEVQNKIDDIAMDIVMNNEVKNDENWQIIKDFRRYLHGRTIKVPAEWHADFDAQGGIDGFRKHNRGRFFVSYTKGESIETLYPEMRGMFGNLLPDISNPADQLIAISDFLDEMAVTFENPYDSDIEAAAESMSLEIMADMLVNIREVGDDVRSKRIEKLHRVLQEERLKRYHALNRVKERQERKIREATEKRKASAEKKADMAARQRLLAVAKKLESLAKKSDAEKQAEIQKLIGHLDLAAVGITGQKLGELNMIKEFYDKMKLNPDFIPDKRIEEKLLRLDKQRIADMKLEDVIELTNLLIAIEHKIRTDAFAIDIEDKRNLRIQAEETLRNIENSSGSKASGIGHSVDTIITNTLTPTRELRRMTGYVDDDPLYLRTKELQSGQVDKFDYAMKAEKMFEKYTNDKKFMESITGAKAKTYTYTIKEKNKEGKVLGDRTITITAGMRISLLLHNQNSDNQKHMKEGGVKLPDIELYKAGEIEEAYARGEKIYLHKTDIEEITKNITEEEREYARQVWRYFNNFSKNEINRVSVKLKGYELAKVKDYYPIEVSEDFMEQNFELVQKDGTIEGIGNLKERTGSNEPIYLRDVASVLDQGIRMHSSYVGLAIPVRNMTVLMSKNFSKYGEASEEQRLVFGKDYTLLEGYYSSIMETIGKKWGVNGQDYIEKMMQDIQGGKEEKRQNDITKKIKWVTNRFIKATLNWNLKVAFNQVASIPAAIPEVGFKAVARSLFDFGRVNTDLIAEYTPLQYMRGKGATNVTIADMTKSNNSVTSKIDNVIDKVDLMTWTDNLMTRKLWKAAIYNIKYTRKDLKTGTREFYEAVADVYTDIMQNTQPNVSMMERPQFLRADETTKMVMTFQGEPLKNVNLLYESAGNLRAKARQLKQIQNNKNSTKEEIEKAENRLKQARSQFGVTVISQILSSLVFAVEKSIFQLLYGKVDDYWDDEEEKVTFCSWLVGTLKDTGINFFTQIPFAAHIVDFVSAMIFKDEQYYPYTPLAFSSLEDLESEVLSFKTSATDLFTGKGISGKEFAFATYEVIEKASNFLGIPTKNVVNLAVSIIKLVEKNVSSNKYVGDYEVLKYEAALTRKKLIDGEIDTKATNSVYDILYRAMRDGDKEGYDIIFKDLVDRGVSYTDIESAMQNRAKKDENFKLDTSLNMYAGVEDRGETEKYEKYIDAAEELGIDEELLKKVVDAANSKKKYKERKTDAEKIINNASLDFESEEFLKNIIADSYSVNDLSKEQYIEYSETRATYLQKVDNEIDSQGMSEREFRKVYNKASDLAEEYALSEASDGEYSMRAKWMYYAVDAEEEVGMTTGEFLKVYEEYGSTIYSTPSLITHEVGYDVSDYLEFHKLTKDIKGEKDEKGKDIKGKTKQDKIIKVLEEMNVSDEMKAYLYSTEYKSNKNNPWKRHLKVNYKEYVEEKKGE